MNRIERVTATLGSTPGVVHFEVSDESHLHGAGRIGDSHLRVLVVAEVFEPMGSLARHRWVNALFADEFRTGLHALAVTARSTAEWSLSPERLASPPCAGGAR